MIKLKKMDETREYTPANERKGLALSGLIMSLLGLLCAFIVSWRMFAIVIALAGLVVSLISLRKAARAHKSRAMQIAAIVISLVAIPAAVYFLYQAPVENAGGEKMELPVKTNR